MNRFFRVFAVLSIFLFGASGAQATLFGLTDGGSPDLLFTIDTTTAAATFIGNTSAGINAIAFAPSIVPEPTTLAIFGIGLVGLAGMRRRRKAA